MPSTAACPSNDAAALDLKDGVSAEATAADGNQKSSGWEADPDPVRPAWGRERGRPRTIEAPSYADPRRHRMPVTSPCRGCRRLDATRASRAAPHCRPEQGDTYPSRVPNDTERPRVPPILIDFPGIGSFAREWLEENSDQAQKILADCKGRYPLCLCRTPGLPLYIARRSRLYLARIPNSGPSHSPSCPSYEPDPSQCGWSIYSPRALSDCGEGRIAIKLGVPLAIRGEGAGAAPTASPVAGSDRPFRETIDLTGLLHLLWERSEFNRWTPRMRNRRHYRQVHKYLLESAEAVHVRRHALTRHLYVPEPYAPEKALEIEARRQRAFRELGQTAGGMPMRILVFGRVRSIVDSGHGPGIRLAHLPNEFVITAAREKLSKLHQATQFAWLDARAIHPEFQVLVLLTMQRAHDGQWQVDELAGMVTTEEFMPTFSIEDALVCKRLIAEDRRFYKPLPYDAVPTRFPNFLLTDCGDTPVPLEIVSGSAMETAARRARIAEYEALQRRFWLWDVVQTTMPPTLLRPAA
jgi:Protein of unknown function (DUF1173)